MANSKSLPATPAQTEDGFQHSTLEVDQERLLENNNKSAPMLGQDPQSEKVVSCTDVGKQAIINYDNVQKEAIITCEAVGQDAVAIGAADTRWEA